MELINRNLEKTEPDYFYKVSEFVTTFGMDPGENESFSHEQKFEGKDLLKCKKDAEKHFLERLEGLEKGKYFLEFAAPKDFEFGKNSCFSINLLFVEYYNEDEFYEYPLIGEDEQTTFESMELEKQVLIEKGYL